MKALVQSHWTVLIAILAVAIGLRVHKIGYHSLWLDELAAFQLSCGRGAASMPPPLDVIQPRGADMTSLDDALPWTSIVPAVLGDTHPPLYFLLLRIWRELFGQGDAIARGLSLAVSVLSILALYDACRLLHGISVARWAALIAALATPQIVYAQEARGYAMVTCFIFCAAAALVRIEKLGPGALRVAVLSASIFAAMLTHYLALPVMLAIGLYAAIQLRGRSRQAALAALLVAGAVFALVWGPLLWKQRPSFTAHLGWLAEDQGGSVLPTLQRLASLPIQFFIKPQATGIDRYAGWLGAAVYLAPLLLLKRRDLLIWVLIGGAIIGTAAFSDLLMRRKSLEYLRFTVAAAPAVYAFAAAVGTHLPRRWIRHALPAVIVVGCLLALPVAYIQELKVDYRRFAADLDKQSTADHLLVVPYRSVREDWMNSLLLSAVTRYSALPHRPVVALSHSPSAELAREIAQSPGVWLLHHSREMPLPFPTPVSWGNPSSAQGIGMLVKLEFAADSN